jgi:uncharacterized protein
MLQPIYIPQLIRAPQQTETIQFDQLIPGMETLTPVRGWLKVTHHGSYLEVSAEAETIVTLSCHRCLQRYNYRLAIAPSELIWLNDMPEEDGPVFDRDLSLDDLLETLPPNGTFDTQTWLYEQLCLEMPQRQLCDPDCVGIRMSASTGPPPCEEFLTVSSTKNPKKPSTIADTVAMMATGPDKKLENITPKQITMNICNQMLM